MYKFKIELVNEAWDTIHEEIITNSADAMMKAIEAKYGDSYRISSYTEEIIH